MFSSLSLASQRVRLVASLRRRNVYVRLHAYEYLLGFAGRIRGVLVLEPSHRKAFLYLSHRDPESEQLAEIVKDEVHMIDPNIEFITIWTGEAREASH